ncbi:MAG: hypothetical protein GX569_01435 [Candidatus Riflebacteria bacterium]|nr:hypothetical protein [Candidatus Riflebacteria bacterium]
MKTKIVEGYWICPKCNTRCRGSDQDCNNCGAVRTADVKFHLAKNAPAITDEKELALAKAGPDWICAFCGNTSPAGEENCTGCGSLRSDGSWRHSEKKPENLPETAESRQEREKEENKETAVAAAKKTAKPARPLTRNEKLGCGAFLLFMLVLFIINCFEKPGRIEIKQTFWKRTIERKQLNATRDSDWKDWVPKNAVVIATSSEIRRYEEVSDGFEEVEEEDFELVQVDTKEYEETVDLGNGRFEVKTWSEPVYEKVSKGTKLVTREKFKKVPIYGEKVVYDILDWDYIDKVVASGSNSPPQWPDIQGTRHDPPQKGDIREHSRKEQYWIEAVMEGESEVFDFDELNLKPLTVEQFKQLQPGTKWDAVFSGLGLLLRIIGPDGKPL